MQFEAILAAPLPVREIINEFLDERLTSEFKKPAGFTLVY